VVHVRYDRFSVYFNEPGKYGLDLRPFPAYAAVYPLQDLVEPVDYPQGYVEIFDPRNSASAAEAFERLQSGSFQLRPFCESAGSPND
jgi:hypothetical protein